MGIGETKGDKTDKVAGWNSLFRADGALGREKKGNRGKTMEMVVGGERVVGSTITPKQRTGEAL